MDIERERIKAALFTKAEQALSVSLRWKATADKMDELSDGQAEKARDHVRWFFFFSMHLTLLAESFGRMDDEIINEVIGVGANVFGMPFEDLAAIMDDKIGHHPHPPSEPNRFNLN